MRSASGVKTHELDRTMAEVIELDNTNNMTPTEALARAGREKFKEVAIIGVDEDEVPVYIFSSTTNMGAFWNLSKAAQLVLDGEVGS